MPADLFTVLFFLVFFLALAIILVQLARGIAQWGRNNASPRLTVDATVVAKREQVWHSQHNHGGRLLSFLFLLCLVDAHLASG